MLAGLVALASLIFVFLKVWAEVADNDAHTLDSRILLALRVAGRRDVPIGPAWLRQAMLDISSLGSLTLLGLLIVAASGYLLIKGARLRALLLATAAFSGWGIVFLLKYFFGRPRPDVVDHLVAIDSLSFPSGHAANSAIVYLTVAALAQEVEPSRAARIYILAVAIMLTILIGVSRLYLGVHWPSDVAAGWALGAGWALAWHLATTIFLARRK